MYKTRLAEPQLDDAFLLEVYGSTRMEEMAQWGWSESDKHSFLHMQYRMQQQSYRMQYPEIVNRIILVNDLRAGRILTASTKEACHLMDISLLPQFRRQGIGSRLIDELKQEAQDRQLPVRLSVLLTNPARRLYERLGFQVMESSEMYMKMEWNPSPLTAER